MREKLLIGLVVMPILVIVLLVARRPGIAIVPTAGFVIDLLMLRFLGRSER